MQQPQVASLFPAEWTNDEILERAKQVQKLGIERGLQYRCVASGEFLRIGLLQNPFRADIMEKKPLKEQRIVEIGCGFGIDVRYLIRQLGVSKDHIVAIDVAPAFIELGYELFQDKEAVESCFHVKSVGDEDFVSFVRDKFSGNPVDVVLAFQVLHTIPQYNEKVVKDVFQLVAPAKGVFMGTTIGIREDREEPRYFHRQGVARIAHTQQSITRLLKQVGGFHRVKTQFLERNIASDSKEWTAENTKTSPLAFIALVE